MNRTKIREYRSGGCVPVYGIPEAGTLFRAVTLGTGPSEGPDPPLLRTVFGRSVPGQSPAGKASVERAVLAASVRSALRISGDKVISPAAREACRAAA